jgi:hypothetical protein
MTTPFHTQKHAKPPLVVLIDFDGTIIGDVEWILKEYQLIREHNSYMKRNGQANKVTKYSVPLLNSSLSHGLIRPYLRTFLTKIKKKHSHVEFFVYTASTQDWAEFIVPKVETILGFKFNRPLLTRKHCLYDPATYTYKKSLDSVLPAIKRSIGKHYNLQKPSDIDKVFLIDNTPSVLLQKSRQVTCSTYDFKYPVDVCRQLAPFSHHPSLFHELRSLLGGQSSADASASREQTLCKYYKLLGTEYEKASKVNPMYTKDRFWKRMTRLFLTADVTGMSTDKLCSYLEKGLSLKKHAT